MVVAMSVSSRDPNLEIRAKKCSLVTRVTKALRDVSRWYVIG